MNVGGAKPVSVVVAGGGNAGHIEPARMAGHPAADDVLAKIVLEVAG